MIAGQYFMPEYEMVNSTLHWADRLDFSWKGKVANWRVYVVRSFDAMQMSRLKIIDLMCPKICSVVSTWISREKAKYCNFTSICKLSRNIIQFAVLSMQYEQQDFIMFSVRSKVLHTISSCIMFAWLGLICRLNKRADAIIVQTVHIYIHKLQIITN